MWIETFTLAQDWLWMTLTFRWPWLTGGWGISITTTVWTLNFKDFSIFIATIMIYCYRKLIKHLLLKWKSTICPCNPCLTREIEWWFGVNKRMQEYETYQLAMSGCRIAIKSVNLSETMKYLLPLLCYIITIHVTTITHSLCTTPRYVPSAIGWWCLFHDIFCNFLDILGTMRKPFEFCDYIPS